MFLFHMWKYKLMLKFRAKIKELFELKSYSSPIRDP